MFPEMWYSWVLWGIHIVSALLVSRIFPVSTTSTKIENPYACGITEAMASAVKAMTFVCGWITIFRILITFLNRWVLWALPVTAQVAIAGLLELSNGCCILGLIDSIPVRFTLCACFLALGGLCVTMQTASAAKGISLRYYIVGKCLQTVFSILLSLSIWHPWLILPLFSGYFLLIMGKFRKNSRNPAAIGV